MRSFAMASWGLAAVAALLLGWSSAAADQIESSQEELAEGSSALDNAKAAVFELHLKTHGPGVARGMGFLLTSDGLAFTNFHFIQGTLGGVAYFPVLKKKAKVDVVKVDANIDFALLRVDMEELGLADPPLILPPKHPVVEGEEVFSIGFVKGLGVSVSAGKVSRQLAFTQIPLVVRQGVRFDTNTCWLDTTCVASPLNSGGPMIRRDGSLVGVTAWFWRNPHGAYALCAQHLEEFFKEMPEKPLTFARALRQHSASRPPHLTAPQLEMPERRTAAQEVINSASAIEDNMACKACDGKRHTLQKKQIGWKPGITPALKQRDMANVKDWCDRCESKGYSKAASLDAMTSKLIRTFASLDLERDPNAAKTARERVRESIKMLLNLQPWLLSDCVNQIALNKFATHESRGEPVFFTAHLQANIGDHVIGGRWRRFLVATNPEVRDPDGSEGPLPPELVRWRVVTPERVVLVDELLISEEPRDDLCLVGGLIAGFMDLENGDTAPVITNGFVISMH